MFVVLRRLLIGQIGQVLERLTLQANESAIETIHLMVFNRGLRSTNRSLIPIKWDLGYRFRVKHKTK
ncbi:MAG: hypothetical protein EBS61_06785 [Betaproteobacteria bacterium]|nr:hypothetical protein [Betaproteobacteria bacterium]